MDIKQQFYEHVYPSGGRKAKPRSVLGFLYLSLKRFESYREDVIFNLLNPGESYVDIGCGLGNLVLRGLSKFDMVYGTDIARTRLKDADARKVKLSKNDQKRIKFILSDADGNLPFDNQSLSAVSMVATLEHFFDPYFIIEEAHRVLKKNGQLVIEVPNLGYLPRRIAVLVGNIPVTSEDENGWDGGHLHYFTFSTLIRLLNEKGFYVTTKRCSGIFANIRSLWPTLLGPDIIIRAVKR
jgi:ubiquinone/menaquinone biosynthesis C-methylase UbiE